MSVDKTIQMKLYVFLIKACSRPSDSGVRLNPESGVKNKEELTDVCIKRPVTFREN